MIGIENRENMLAFVEQMLCPNSDSESIILGIKMAEKAKMKINEILKLNPHIQYFPFNCVDGELTIPTNVLEITNSYYLVSYLHVLPENATLTVFKNMIMARLKRQTE
jgi:hypothetical protein